MRNFIKLFFAISLFLSISNANVFAQQDTLTQVSTIDALFSGIYDGETAISELKQYGNFGLGTFNALDGEMLLIDGRFYQINTDGKARQADSNIKTPFAAVTFFETDQTLALLPGVNFDSLKKQMDQVIPTPNLFYAIRIEGVFKAVKARSIPKQSKPYKLPKEIFKTQPIFNYENVEGTMGGFRCPPYVKGINIPGYHFHFLTKDGKAGGHVLEFTIKEAVLKIDHTSVFSMILPQDKAFYDADLTRDKEAELKKVER
ncbi:MAG: acetolactate decarboxylase [Desulfobacterales bacterium]|nr:acetolactate decarboxylase [Desulfobacterales bacterium]